MFPSIRSGASGRRHLHVPYRTFLGLVLLASQALVPILLAQNQILESVVRIQAVNGKNQTSQRGTGIVVDNGIVTAAHVVENCDYVAIHLDDGDNTSSLDGEVVKVDSFMDLALIRVVAILPPAKLNTDFPVQPGTEVYAIGNSLGYTRTVSKGIVSASGTKRGEKYLFSDVLTRKGNSGGPLVNHKGEVIAMVLGTLDTAPVGQLPAKDNSPEFTYTIHASDIEQFLKKGDIPQKGYLGVSGKTVRVSLGNDLNDDGLEITKVTTDCGLKTKDILVSINNDSIGSLRDLIRAVRALSPGTEATAYLLRNGVFTEQKLQIYSLPANDLR